MPAEHFATRASPRLRTREARLFRTMLRAQAAEGPNFAGHATVAIWGCGTGCMSFAVVDARTGDVSFPPSFHTVEQVAAAPFDHLVYRPDSRLLMVTGAPDEDFDRLGVRFYVWTRGKLRLVKRYRYEELCPQASSSKDATPP